MCHGGFADVSKRECRGQEVAVKVLRARKGNGLRVMTSVSLCISLYSLANRT